MRFPRGLTIVFGGLVLVGLLAAAYFASRPRGPIIREASFSHQTITPNADGQDDAAEVDYRIRRQATVSIYFLDDNDQRYNFRTDEVRARGSYRVLFSGVVDGFTLPGEQIGGDVINRLIPDGTYTWVIEAVDALTGSTDRQTGALVVANGDPVLPALQDFSISPSVFTPNQDGIDDLVWINTYLPKPADMLVYLTGDDGTQYYIPESQQETGIGEGGRHTFQWDGGVDMGRNPPPDGTYEVTVDSRDAEGQRVMQSGEVTVAFGGVPLAEIVGQPVGDTVEFSSETVLLGDVLYFKLTVENYGDAPIRTTGPAPGYVYDQSDLYSSTGFYDESGAWRVGIHCDTCETDYPWRWALGSEDDLTPIETNGQVHYYLMPGQRAVVTGGIRLTNIIKARNPQQFWAGLIHEDVEISEVNQRVDPHWIEIVPTDDGTDSP